MEQNQDQEMKLLFFNQWVIFISLLLLILFITIQKYLSTNFFIFKGMAAEDVAVAQSILEKYNNKKTKQ